MSVDSPQHRWRAVFIIGPAGCGKTTVARRLAAHFAAAFVEADEHHTAEARAKINSGVGVDDDYRRAWLARVAGAAQSAIAQGRQVVVACSVLKRSFRSLIREIVPDVRFVALAVPTETLRSRLAERRGHFAGVSLLAGQLAAWEPLSDSEGVSINADQPIDDVIRQIVDRLESSPQ